MGENHFERITVAAYAALALFCGMAYTILEKQIIKHYDESPEFKPTLGKRKVKAIASIVLYATAIPVALFINPLISCALFLSVSIMWLVPEKSIANVFDKQGEL